MPPVPHIPAAEADVHAALVVALDAGDPAGDDLARAAALLDACPGCAALRADLVAIRGAMTALPVPPRRRDFRLTVEDAARLRPSGWRRLAGWLAAPRSPVRPLATGLAALGVAGLLLSAGIPSFGAGGAAFAPSTAGAPAGDVEANTAPELAAPTSLPLTVPAGSPAPSWQPDRFVATAAPADLSTPRPAEEPGTGASDGSGDYAAGAETRREAAAEPGVPAEDASVPLPVVASLGLLAAGLGLFAARALARSRLA